MKLLYVTVITITLTLFASACREPQNSDADLESLRQSCLRGASWKTNICGPFSSDTISKCIAMGGGEKACNSDRWDRAFHKRVVDSLPKDKQELNCVRKGESLGIHKCGPFTAAEVEKCLALTNKSQACYTNRWNKNVYESVTKALKGGGSFSSTTSQNKVISNAPSSGSFLYVRKTGGIAWAGLNKLILTYFKDGTEMGSVTAISGLPSQQYAGAYRTKRNVGPAGSGQPIPEGYYSLGYPESGGGVPGIGPIWIGIYPDPWPRGAFGIHLDEGLNGTMGCIGVYSVSDIQRVASWVRAGARRLIVDWKLGTVSANNFSLLESFSLVEDNTSTLERAQKFYDAKVGEIAN